MGKPKSKVFEVQVRGPLSAIAEDFRVGLLEAGYTPLTAVNKLRSVGYLSKWLEARELEPSDLNEERIQEYLRGRRAEGHDWEISRRALRPILELMASRGMLPPPPKRPPVEGVEALFARFHRYRYYTCYSRQRYGNDTCAAERVDAGRLDEAVLESLLHTYEDERVLEEAVQEYLARSCAARPNQQEQLPSRQRSGSRKRPSTAISTPSRQARWTRISAGPAWMP